VSVHSVAPDAKLFAEIDLSVADGRYGGQTVDLNPRVRLVIRGTRSAVTRRDLYQRHECSTILITGGSLELCDSFIPDTTGGNRAAFETRLHRSTRPT
jgi:hypothetical protein